MHKYKWTRQYAGQEGPRNRSGLQTEFVRGGVHNTEISLGLYR